MILNPQNIIYVYNSGDEDSVRLAQEYALIRQVPSSNLLGLDVFTKSVLDSREEFETQLENPIKQAIDSLGGFGRTIFSCVLGYRIPAGYYSEHGVISSCSAIAAMYLGDKDPVYNPAYRQEQKDVSFYEFGVLPTCQQDMPTYSAMKKKLADFSKFVNKINADGSLYFDRWSLKETFSIDSYAAELKDFEINLIPNYFKRYYLTSEPIEDVRSDFGYAENDSFFWSAGLENLTQSYFINSKKANRILFFNGDTDSFKSFRSDNEFGPAMAALYSGYVAAVGMMSDFVANIDADPYVVDPYSFNSQNASSCWIRPEPFFKSLAIETTLLNAIYFSMPLLNCPLTIFTDPLMKVDLKDTLAIPTKISARDGWSDIHLKLSEIGSLANNRANAALTILSRAGTYSGIEEQLGALKNFSFIQSGNDGTSLKSFAQPAVSGWKKFIEIAYFETLDVAIPNFLRFINEIDFKLTNGFIYLNLNEGQVRAEIQTENIESNGFFYIETKLPSTNIGTGYYNIQIDVYENIDDERPVVTSVSYDDFNNWLVEDFDKKYRVFPAQGLFSSLTDRKIRFINRKVIPNKKLGNSVWVKFVYMLDNGSNLQSSLQEVLVIS